MENYNEENYELVENKFGIRINPNNKRDKFCYELSIELLKYFNYYYQIDVRVNNKYNMVWNRIYTQKNNWKTDNIECLLIFLMFKNECYYNKISVDNRFEYYKTNDNKLYGQLKECEKHYNNYNSMFKEYSHYNFRYLDKNYKMLDRCNYNVEDYINKLKTTFKIDDYLLRRLKNQINIQLNGGSKNDYTFYFKVWEKMIICKIYSKWYCQSKHRKKGAEYLRKKYYKYTFLPMVNFGCVNKNEWRLEFGGVEVFSEDWEWINFNTTQSKLILDESTVNP